MHSSTGSAIDCKSAWVYEQILDTDLLTRRLYLNTPQRKPVRDTIGDS